LTASEDFILTTRQFSLKFRKWAWKMCSQTGSGDSLGWWRTVANTTPDNQKRIELCWLRKRF
jgi:hypothetical protein